MKRYILGSCFALLFMFNSFIVNCYAEKKIFKELWNAPRYELDTSKKMEGGVNYHISPNGVGDMIFRITNFSKEPIDFDGATYYMLDKKDKLYPLKRDGDIVDWGNNTVAIACSIPENIKVLSYEEFNGSIIKLKSGEKLNFTKPSSTAQLFKQLATSAVKVQEFNEQVKQELGKLEGLAGRLQKHMQAFTDLMQGMPEKKYFKDNPQEASLVIATCQAKAAGLYELAYGLNKSLHVYSCLLDSENIGEANEVILTQLKSVENRIILYSHQYQDIILINEARKVSEWRSRITKEGMSLRDTVRELTILFTRWQERVANSKLQDK
jgi:hypothetical protein